MAVVIIDIKHDFGVLVTHLSLNAVRLLRGKIQKGQHFH